MIPPSTRYAIPLSLMLVPAIMLMLLEHQLRTPVDDCADPAALYDTISISGTEAPRELWEKHDELRMQWSEGLIRVDLPEVEPLRFRIVRSHNPKPLYRSPMNFLPEKIEMDWGELQQVPADGTLLPIHKVYGHDDSDVLLGAYLFVYGSRPVEDPYLTQLWSVAKQLVSGGRPLTLIAVTGNARGDRFEAADRAATDWIVRAWLHYQSVCSPQN